MKSYKWTRSYPVDAQIVGEIVEGLPERSADYLLREAKKKTSPIHSLFEWDDTVAAREYRLLQARLIINSLEVEIIQHDKTPRHVKAFIKKSDDSSQYVNVQSATVDDLSAAEAECLRQMSRFQERFNGLSIAKDVIIAMRDARKKVARKRRKAA